MAKINLTKYFPPTTTTVLEINEILRESDKVQFGLSFKTNLGSSQSYVGNGVTYNATLKVSGTGIETQTKIVQLKDSDEYWQGTATHTLNKLSWEVNVPSNANSVLIEVTYKYSDEATTMSGSTEITLTKLLNVLNPFSNNESLDLEQAQTLSITQYDSTFTSNLELIVKNNQNQNVTIANFENVEDGQQISLNETQLNALFNATSNKQKYQMFWLLYTLNNGTSIGNTTTQSMGIINNANPIFTDFNYQDINSITSALSNNVILGYSTLKVSIPTNKKAIAQKGASIVSYSVEDISLPYSSTQEVYTDPGLPNYNKNTLSVTAYDTRQNSTPVVKNLNVVNYVKLTADETQKSYQRQNNVGTQTKITFGGTWWNDNFGLKDNALTVSYKYKIVGSTTWTPGGNITPIISGNNYSFDNYIRGDAPDNGFSVKNSYDLVVRVEDKLDYVEFVYQIIAGAPAMKIKGNKVLEINDIPFEELIPSSPQKNIITVSTNAQTSISANSNIPFNTIYAQCGDTKKLKVYSGGGVLIGAGVSKVLVSFVVNSNSNDRKWFYLRKNGVKVGDYISQTGTSYHTATYSPQLFEVQEGDYFQVLNFIGTITLNGGISNPKASFMTIEVIE